MNALWLRSIFFLPLIAACISMQTGVLHDSYPPGNPLLDLSLDVSGPDATTKWIAKCIVEGRKHGVRLRPGASVQASLFLSSDGNSSLMRDGQNFAIEQRVVPGICRIAFAKAAGLDQKIKTAKTEPSGRCRALGTVSGQDTGTWEIPGSRAASVAAAQFEALRMGANYLCIDSEDTWLEDGDWGNRILRTTGRIFFCQDPSLSRSQEPSGASPAQDSDSVTIMK